MSLRQIKHHRLLTLPTMGLGLVWACTLMPIIAKASEYKTQIPSYNAASTTITGITGLNSVPTSRMDKAGKIRLGVGTNDPYLHTFLGMQVADPLYVSLRQTHEISSLVDSAKRLYPGMDFKLRLREETAKRPALSFGANAAFGHKRHSSEYLAFSKRKNNFDFTGGIAWGRLAGKGHIKNPLSAVSSHFDEDRDFNDESAQNIDNWFTGEKIGFFGGVEYFTPVKGLSLKADYAPIDYTAEKSTNNGFNAPQPWSLGLNYKPFNYKPIDLSLGIIGGEKIFARISAQNLVSKWIGKPSKIYEPPELKFPRAADNEASSHIALNLSAHQSIGKQIGHEARRIANQSSPDNENIEITLNHNNLKGPKLNIIRRDLEEAILNNHGSAEEIWHDVEFSKNKTPFFKVKNYFKDKRYNNLDYKFIWDNKVSLSEAESGILYRSSLRAEIDHLLPLGLKMGIEPQVNLADNLGSLSATATNVANPIRSNEGDFSSNRIAMNRLYTSWLYSLNQNTHVKLSAGYLEEMFGGFGGEILYRPFGKTFAIGAEAWEVRQRDGNSALALLANPEKITTGHLNLFYESPNKNTTIFAKAGQYLAKDLGATFGLKNSFKNGSQLEAFITATDKSDPDSFGSSKHLYGGVKFTLPLGNVPYIPDGSEIRVTTAPFARDAGQVLNAPDALYEVTEPIAYRRLSQSWPDLLR